MPAPPPRLAIPVVQATAMLMLAAGLSAADREPVDLNAVGVRILFGVDDQKPTPWDGSAKLAEGEIRHIEAWRFRPGDAVQGRSGWKTSSHVLQTPPKGPPRMAPTGVILTIVAPPSAQLTIETVQGGFRFAVSDLVPGRSLSMVGGRVLVDAVAPAVAVTNGGRRTENDFPAAATAQDGSVWVAFVQHTHRGPAELQSFQERPKDFRFLIPEGGGDQVAVVRFDGQTWSEPMPVSRAGLDVWRPAIAADGRGFLHVVWSQNCDGNWDLFEQIVEAKPAANVPSRVPRRLTTEPGSDVFAALATDRSGHVWLAWQSWRDRQSDIWLLDLGTGGWESSAGAPMRVTDSPADEWSPALAADGKGRMHVAYDTYAAGNYDVYLRTLDAGKLLAPVAVARSPKFEASPSIVCDRESRIWVAYEQRGSNWGKDTGPLAAIEGSPLYMNGTSVQVRVVERGELLQPAGAVMQEFPEDLRRLNSYPRIGMDGRGRPWLVFRHRHEVVWGGNPAHIMVGGVWLEYATHLSGERWAAPLFLAASDNLLDVRPALVSTGSGRLLAIYPSDGRLRREVFGNEDQRKVFFVSAGVSVPGQARSDLFAATLPGLDPPLDPLLSPASADVPGPDGPPAESPKPKSSGPRAAEADKTTLHPNSAADIRLLRDCVLEAGGKKYRIFRGEFHRHTEMSADGGNDGSLEDMWRYALDAADFDWIGNGDHDNGGGREYSWWLIQKTTDIFTVPSRFLPMYTYERSVPYPNGHRNAMFDRRGIRPLPRLLGTDPGGVSADDTKMFYDYLDQLGGICASHTSGTGMGTDWRDNSPTAEPIVEIYQGDRNSYEALGAPRVASKQANAIGGWKPLGIIWNALAMGYRLGFQSSSDHWSTHISYAMAIAEDHTRPALLDAFRQRHCYAATDDILLDVRMGDHLMGDRFELDGGTKPKLAVRIHGTAPIQRVDVIKDFVYAYSMEPKQPVVQFEWTDHDPQPGLSWYYVRVLQTDTQVAWASPIWVQVRAAR